MILIGCIGKEIKMLVLVPTSETVKLSLTRKEVTALQVLCSAADMIAGGSGGSEFQTLADRIADQILQQGATYRRP